jgi:Flp pilus assembly protein TadD
VASAGRPRDRRGRVVRGRRLRRVSAVLFVLAASLGLAARGAAQTPPGTTRILVMPFEASERDPREVWLGEASAVLLADALRAVGMPALTRTERVRAFEDLNLPPDGTLSYASLIRVGQLVAASDLIVGSLRVSGADLVLDARRIRLDTGRVQTQVTDRAALRDLFALHERVARRLMGLPASAATAASATATPPLEAFENYIKGLVAEQPQTQVKFLQSALAAWPGYDRAELALWDAWTAQGDHARALAAANAVKPASRLSRRARFAAGLSLVELKRLDEAFTTFKALLDEQPAASLHNNLGVVQVRRGATAQTGKPTFYFSKASEFDAEEPDYFFNLGYAYWLDRDTQAAIYWLREAVRRNTADGDAHFVLGAALQVAGSASEAARERELARQLSSKYAEWERRAAAGGDAVPKGLERLTAELEAVRGTRLDAALLGSAQREQQQLATFHLERGRRLFDHEQNHDAVAELRKAIYLAPYEAEPHVLLGRIYLRTGRPREAADELRVALWSRESAEARLALADALLQMGEAEAARTEASRALELAPGSPEAKALLARIDKR